MLSRRRLLQGVTLLAASGIDLANAAEEHGKSGHSAPSAGAASSRSEVRATTAQPPPAQPLSSPYGTEMGPSPDEALGRLKHGNAIYARGGASMALPSWTRMAELAQGQKPFAVIVGCSDSRVPPELLFDCSIGELFVVRVAGSTVDRVGLGSIVYAVEHLGAPLIVVLGHTKCGAVSAAVDVVTKHAHLDPALNDMALPIMPAVIEAGGSPQADLLDASIRTNVKMTAQRLENAHYSIHEKIEAGHLRIVPACYDLSTGLVQFMI